MPRSGDPAKRPLVGGAGVRAGGVGSSAWKPGAAGGVEAAVGAPATIAGCRFAEMPGGPDGAVGAMTVVYASA